jgi:ADP-heptose:LPS heptosyltransferase
MRVGGNKQPKLLAKARYDLVRFTRGKVLDIGRGEWKAYPHFIGVREKGDDTIAPPVTPDFVVDSFAHMADFIEGSMDAVFIWGIPMSPGLYEQAVRLIKDGGYLITVDAGNDREDLPHTMVVRRERDGIMEPIGTKLDILGRPTALVIRYGAIGDVLQTASMFPQLHRDYHVTVNCHPIGEEVLRHDPNVDDFLVQDPDQVPNGELNNYFAHLATRYDRVINLCESVEGALLAMPGRSNHRWPLAMRKKYLNENYLEFMCQIAELPLETGGVFHPSEEERSRALTNIEGIAARINADVKFGEKSRRPFVITWALAGSSVHKYYPGQDAVVARILLDIPNVHIILVGDEFAQMLEAGWENEPRVSRLCGMLPIRDSLALAQVSDLVIGPETGVLNAVAFESMAKIVFLSHSTEENLTRDWVNTEALSGDVPCYPCHRLHYNRDFCPQDEETGAAVCQVAIHPSTVWEAVQRAFVGWGTVRRLLDYT